MEYTIYLLNGECINTKSNDSKAVFEMARNIKEAVFFSIKPHYWLNGTWVSTIN